MSEGNPELEQKKSTRGGKAAKRKGLAASYREERGEASVVLEPGLEALRERQRESLGKYNLRLQEELKSAKARIAELEGAGASTSASSSVATGANTSVLGTRRTVLVARYSHARSPLQDIAGEDSEGSFHSSVPEEAATTSAKRRARPEAQAAAPLDTAAEPAPVSAVDAQLESSFLEGHPDVEVIDVSPASPPYDPADSAEPSPARPLSHFTAAEKAEQREKDRLEIEQFRARRAEEYDKPTVDKGPAVNPPGFSGMSKDPQYSAPGQRSSASSASSKSYADVARENRPASSRPAVLRRAVHAIVDFNGTLNVGFKREVPVSFIRSLQRLTEVYGVIWHLVSFVGINDSHGHWENLKKTVSDIEAEHGLVFHHVERVFKKTGAEFWSKYHNTYMSGKDAYAFKHQCVVILDDNREIIDACKDIGCAAYQVGSCNQTVDSVCARLTERLAQGSAAPLPTEVWKPTRHWT
jgi:hypothetical protein